MTPAYSVVIILHKRLLETTKIIHHPDPTSLPQKTHPGGTPQHGSSTVPPGKAPGHDPAPAASGSPAPA